MYEDTETESNVVIRINKLKVWTKEEKSWWRRRPNRPKNLILDNVSGCIRENEFAAVIGPSGAGKTTFLVSLAGKVTLPSDGTVTVRGRDVKEMAGVVEIVPQFDVFIDKLTAMEHLVFMTEMKIGDSNEPAIRTKLEGLLKELNLSNLKDTPIVSLSGGERKLLSLATSLLSDPQILICDEPTTGLDSYNALAVVEILKKLASSGRIVVCSVHQPSSDLFNEFTSILLMTEGKLLFHGSHEKCRQLFESVNLHCPKNYNPAEFYIRAVSDLNSHNSVERLMDSYKEEHIGNTTDIQCTPTKMRRRNWFKQVSLLLWRSSLTMKRNLRSHVFQLLFGIMMSSLVLGTCYVGISGTTQRGIQDIRGLLWLMTSEVSFTISYGALYVFESDLTLYRREIGLYSCTAYYVTTFFGFIPRCVVWPIMLVFIATLAVELPDHVLTAVEFTTALMLTAVGSTAYGLGMGALFSSTGLMSEVMPCADLPLFLMSGAFLRLSSLPSWLYPIKYISHFYYGMDAVSNIYWQKIGKIDCPSNSTTPCVEDGAAVLMETGYSDHFVLQDTIGLTSVITMWSLLAYFGLKRQEKKGYAY
ncbi:protein brown isoform X2 [Amyelois transitella]|uniref:protein brown isoform X2 n=1 Tax=Amyelois transitella TaxID=680683 RepID=UPI00298FFCCE|nr:protein brown isoform X2 [Amyelois transitella]